MFYRADHEGSRSDRVHLNRAGILHRVSKLKSNGDIRIIAHARDVKDIVIRMGIQPGSGIYFDSG